MPYHPWSLADLARHIGARDGSERRCKLMLEFVRGYVEAPVAARAVLIAEER